MPISVILYERKKDIPTLKSLWDITNSEEKLLHHALLKVKEKTGFEISEYKDLILPFDNLGSLKSILESEVEKSTTEEQKRILTKLFSIVVEGIVDRKGLALIGE